MSEETKTEETKEETKDLSTEEVGEKKVEVPAKFKSLVEEVEKMSVLDLAELVSILEDKFGVSAAAPAAAAVAAPAGGEAGGAEEKSEFDVELAEVGDSKINVIKAIKEMTGLGLADAKALTDNVPSNIKEGVAKAEAEEMKKTLEGAGAKVNLK